MSDQKADSEATVGSVEHAEMVRAFYAENPDIAEELGDFDPASSYAVCMGAGAREKRA